MVPPLSLHTHRLNRDLYIGDNWGDVGSYLSLVCTSLASVAWLSLWVDPTWPFQQGEAAVMLVTVGGVGGWGREGKKGGRVRKSGSFIGNKVCNSLRQRRGILHDPVLLSCSAPRIRGAPWWQWLQRFACCQFRLTAAEREMMKLLACCQFLTEVR